MEASFPILFAAAVGFGHAFEADHLVAVGNLVSKRQKLSHAIKDGIFWGLGHTSTIFLIGIIMIVGRSTFLNGYFSYLEALVGLMLIALGIYRIYEYHRDKKESRDNITDATAEKNRDHHLAYGIGLIHGIAGSGAMILLVMTEVQGTLNSILYLVVFGLGSVIGMLVASGIFSMPFSKRFAGNEKIYFILVLISSVICIGLGVHILLENLL